MDDERDARTSTSESVADHKGAIRTERALLALIVVSLAATLNLIVAIHRHMPPASGPLDSKAAIAQQPALPRVATGPSVPADSGASLPELPEPAEALPPPEDPTEKALAGMATATAGEIEAGQESDRRASALEVARQASVAESLRWKRRELLVRQQIAGLAARADELDSVASSLDAERDVLAREQDALKAALVKAGRRSGFAVLPYKGPNGTWRRPIVLDCTAGGAKLQPKGETFTSLELSPLVNPRSSPLVRAIAREMLHIQASDTPDGAAAVPYLVFLVRPTGIRPYYEARTCLEPLGIAFGYELIEQNLAVDIPDFDNLATWDGSVPLEMPLEAAPRPRTSIALNATPPRGDGAPGSWPPSSGLAGQHAGGNSGNSEGTAPEDFVWPGRGRQDGTGNRAISAPGASGPGVGAQGNTGDGGGLSAQGDSTGLTARGPGGAQAGPRGGASSGPLGDPSFSSGGIDGKPGLLSASRAGPESGGGSGPGLSRGSGIETGPSLPTSGGTGPNLVGDGGVGSSLSGGTGTDTGASGGGATGSVLSPGGTGSNLAPSGGIASALSPGGGTGSSSSPVGAIGSRLAPGGGPGSSPSPPAAGIGPSLSPLGMPGASGAAGGPVGSRSSPPAPGDQASSSGGTSGDSPDAGANALPNLEPAGDIGSLPFPPASSLSSAGAPGTAGSGAGGQVMGGGLGQAGAGTSSHGGSQSTATGLNGGNQSPASGSGSGPVGQGPPATGGSVSSAAGLSGRGGASASTDANPAGGGVSGNYPATASTGSGSSSQPSQTQTGDPVDGSQGPQGSSVSSGNAGTASGTAAPRQSVPGLSVPGGVTSPSSTSSPGLGLPFTVSSSSSSSSSSSASGGMPLDSSSTSSASSSSTPSFGESGSPAPESSSDDLIFAPPPRSTPPRGSIEVPFEIVVVCRQNDVLLHPGGYRLTAQALRGQGVSKDSTLAREIVALVRKRAIVDPLIRPKPKIKFLVEANGSSTFWTARRQLLFSLPEWPMSLQVSGTQDLHVFTKETW